MRVVWVLFLLALCVSSDNGVQALQDHVVRSIHAEPGHAYALSSSETKQLLQLSSSLETTTAVRARSKEPITLSVIAIASLVVLGLSVAAGTAKTAHSIAAQKAKIAEEHRIREKLSMAKQEMCDIVDSLYVTSKANTEATRLVVGSFASNLNITADERASMLYRVSSPARETTLHLARYLASNCARPSTLSKAKFFLSRVAIPPVMDYVKMSDFVNFDPSSAFDFTADILKAIVGQGGAYSVSASLAVVGIISSLIDVSITILQILHKVKQHKDDMKEMRDKGEEGVEDVKYALCKMVQSIRAIAHDQADKKLLSSVLSNLRASVGGESSLTLPPDAATSEQIISDAGGDSGGDDSSDRTALSDNIGDANKAIREGWEGAGFQKLEETSKNWAKAVDDAYGRAQCGEREREVGRPRAIMDLKATWVPAVALVESDDDSSNNGTESYLKLVDDVKGDSRLGKVSLWVPKSHDAEANQHGPVTSIEWFVLSKPHWSMVKPTTWKSSYSPTSYDKEACTELTVKLTSGGYEGVSYLTGEDGSSATHRVGPSGGDQEDGCEIVNKLNLFDFHAQQCSDAFPMKSWRDLYVTVDGVAMQPQLFLLFKRGSGPPLRDLTITDSKEAEPSWTSLPLNINNNCKRLPPQPSARYLSYRRDGHLYPTSCKQWITAGTSGSGAKFQSAASPDDSTNDNQSPSPSTSTLPIELCGSEVNGNSFSAGVFDSVTREMIGLGVRCEQQAEAAPGKASLASCLQEEGSTWFKGFFDEGEPVVGVWSEGNQRVWADYGDGYGQIRSFFSNGTVVIYTGEVRNGVPHGLGRRDTLAHVSSDSSVGDDGSVGDANSLLHLPSSPVVSVLREGGVWADGALLQSVSRASWSADDVSSSGRGDSDDTDGGSVLKVDGFDVILPMYSSNDNGAGQKVVEVEDAVVRGDRAANKARCGASLVKGEAGEDISTDYYGEFGSRCSVGDEGSDNNANVYGSDGTLLFTDSLLSSLSLFHQHVVENHDADLSDGCDAPSWKRDANKLLRQLNVRLSYHTDAGSNYAAAVAMRITALACPKLPEAQSISKSATQLLSSLVSSGRAGNQDSNNAPIIEAARVSLLEMTGEGVGQSTCHDPLWKAQRSFIKAHKHQLLVSYTRIFPSPRVESTLSPEGKAAVEKAKELQSKCRKVVRDHSKLANWDRDSEPEECLLFREAVENMYMATATCFDASTELLAVSSRLEDTSNSAISVVFGQIIAQLSLVTHAFVTLDSTVPATGLQLSLANVLDKLLGSQSFNSNGGEMLQDRLRRFKEMLLESTASTDYVSSSAHLRLGLSQLDEDRVSESLSSLLSAFIVGRSDQVDVRDWDFLRRDMSFTCHDLTGWLTEDRTAKLKSYFDMIWHSTEEWEQCSQSPQCLLEVGFVAHILSCQLVGQVDVGSTRSQAEFMKEFSQRTTVDYVTFESQRWYPFSGWSNKLLPTDTKHWSDATGEVEGSHAAAPGPLTLSTDLYDVCDRAALCEHVTAMLREGTGGSSGLPDLKRGELGGRGELSSALPPVDFRKDLCRPGFGHGHGFYTRSSAMDELMVEVWTAFPTCNPADLDAVVKFTCKNGLSSSASAMDVCRNMQMEEMDIVKAATDDEGVHDEYKVAFEKGWHVDVSWRGRGHRGVDAREGWEYAKSFPSRKELAQIVMSSVSRYWPVTTSPTKTALTVVRWRRWIRRVSYTNRFAQSGTSALDVTLPVLHSLNATPEDKAKAYLLMGHIIAGHCASTFGSFLCHHLTRVARKLMGTDEKDIRKHIFGKAVDVLQGSVTSDREGEDNDNDDVRVVQSRYHLKSLWELAEIHLASRLQKLGLSRLAEEERRQSQIEAVEDILLKGDTNSDVPFVNQFLASLARGESTQTDVDTETLLAQLDQMVARVQGMTGLPLDSADRKDVELTVTNTFDNFGTGHVLSSDEVIHNRCGRLVNSQSEEIVKSSEQQFWRTFEGVGEVQQSLFFQEQSNACRRFLSTHQPLTSGGVLAATAGVRMLVGLNVKVDICKAIEESVEPNEGEDAVYAILGYWFGHDTSPLSLSSLTGLRNVVKGCSDDYLHTLTKRVVTHLVTRLSSNHPGDDSSDGSPMDAAGKGMLWYLYLWQQGINPGDKWFRPIKRALRDVLSTLEHGALDRVAQAMLEVPTTAPHRSKEQVLEWLTGFTNHQPQ